MLPAVSRQLLLLHVSHPLTLDADVALVSCVNAADDIQERRFTGTGWPQQHTEFALFHGQVDPL